MEKPKRQTTMRTGEEKTNYYGDRTISVVTDLHQTTTKEFKLDQVISWIKEGRGKFSDNIKAVRSALANNDKELADTHKRKLPAVMFSGTFEKRSSKHLKVHSGILCLDFDHLDNPRKHLDELRYDPHIIASFVSPSGQGIKVLMAIEQDEQKHLESFRSCEQYMRMVYSLDVDQSGKDVSRLCFLSCDEQMHYSEEAVPLPIYSSTKPAEPKKSKGGRVGDRYNEAPDARERSATILKQLGWQLGNGDSEKTYCTRPNKTRGVSGTLWSNGSFYCFSDNASPLEPSKSYSPFALYTFANHGGDFKTAVQQLACEGFGDDVDTTTSTPTERLVVEDSEDAKEEVTHSSLPVWTSCSDIPEDLSKLITMRYPVLVDGLLHRGTKMVLGGGSKSYKTWTLLNLAVCVATGKPWFGREVVTTDQDVVFINFEVAHEFFLQRVRTVCNSMGVEPPTNLKVWSLRGKCNDLSIILEALQERLTNGASLIVIDPIYKGLAGRDENSAGDIGTLMNEVELIVEKTGSAVAFGAHYSKGNQAEKDPLDRISGSGVFARDPDTIMGLTAHEEDGCFTVHSALRNFAGIEPFVVEWDFPLFQIRDDLDASKLKRHGQKVNGSKMMEVLARHIPAEGLKKKEIVDILKDECGIANATAYRHIDSLVSTGKLSTVLNKYFLSTLESR